MSDIKGSSPAFPFTERNYDGSVYSQFSGLTVRDYFAAKAMQGMLANPNLQEQILRVGQSWIELSAYKVADAMLKAREVDPS